MTEVSSPIEPLPVYVDDQVPQSPFDALLTRIAVPLSSSHPDARQILESFVESQKAPVYYGPEKVYVEPPKPIDQYPRRSSTEGFELTLVKRQIVKELYNSIIREDTEAIAMLIQHNLTSANAISEKGQTPLLVAVSSKNIPVVKLLLESGADCNMFGVEDGAKRTPLMLAASLGSLPLVKLLFEPPYSANDALVAPDGQIALRLAAAGEYGAIVEYLPARRSGGYRRFKVKNAERIARITKALHKIGTFIKFFIWDIPKYFIWTLPKELVVEPIVKGCKWCWLNRKKFGPWCKHQLTEIPKKLAGFGRACWKVAKKVPEAVWKIAKKVPNAVKETAKALWRLIKKIPDAVREIALALWKLIKKIPDAVREIALALWKFITVRIPRALVIASIWVWAGVKSIGLAIWDIILKIVSFIHTTFEAIVSFLRNVTLKDIWNGFCDILRAVFVTFPAILWSWIQNFGGVSYHIMGALFGFFGKFLWSIVFLINYLVFYIPLKLWIILKNLGGSIASGFHEIIIFINPKS